MMQVESNVDYYFLGQKLVDYRLCDIKIDYYHKKIFFEMYDEGKNVYDIKHSITLCFEDFISFKISNLKPWGRGVYVCANILETLDSEKKYIIQLNSGDTCEVVCKL